MIYLFIYLSINGGGGAGGWEGLEVKFWTFEGGGERERTLPKLNKYEQGGSSNNRCCWEYLKANELETVSGIAIDNKLNF